MSGHTNSYSCKHFTSDWKKSINQNAKGLAGELVLFDRLKAIALVKKYPAPVLLGEPDIETELLARKDSFPDCLLTIDDYAFLFEARNLCFDIYTKPARDLYLGMFFRIPLEHRGRSMGARDVTTAKEWNAPRYPIRGTKKQVWDSDLGRPVWQYARYTDIIKENDRTKVYISTLPSYNPPAWQELVRFFGKNMVFTEHPMLTPDLWVDSEDETCAEETEDNLLVSLVDLIDRNLKR